MRPRLEVNILSILLVIFAIGTGSAMAKDIFVDIDATGVNNGASWTNAYNSLQEALSQAVAGDVIKVAAGTYTPVPDAGMLDPREATFQLKNGVTVKGGWGGVGEPKPNHRDPDIYPTILSGDLAGNDMPAADMDRLTLEALLDDPLRQDNCYTVVTGSTYDDRNDASTVLDGCTITGGHANKSDYDVHPLMGQRGGGLFVHFGSPTIVQCIIIENVSLRGGGGITVHQADPNLIDCTVIGNYSFELGGGMANFTATPTITNCTFANNAIEMQGEGGGIYNAESNSHILECTFVDNYGGRRGGGVFNWNSSPDITSCVFENNITRSAGGAIDTQVDGQVEVDEQIVMNCVFVGNTSANGGAIGHSGNTGLVANCIFNSNSATLGGAGYHNKADIDYFNCTFVGNTADTASVLGANSSTPPDSRSNVAVRNSILYEEETVQFDLLEGVDGTPFTVTYCCMFNKGGTGYLTHSISLPPMFVDPIGLDGIAGTLDDDLRLSPSSPCIDAGSNTYIQLYIPDVLMGDFAGRPRFVDIPFVADTGDGTPPLVDIGAHERQLPGPAVPVADAGPDQVAYAWIDGIADVTLDGSGSSDADGDELLYEWTWRVGGQTFTADGVNPEIELPVGEHVITLVVSDYIRTSAPDKVTIYVLGPFEANLTVSPQIINRNDVRVEYITVTATLYEIAENEVDMNTPLFIVADNGTDIVPALGQWLFDVENGDVVKTTILALFDKDAVMDTIPENGGTKLTVTGVLLSGQLFEGTGMMNISGEIIPDVNAPVPNPMEWALPEPDLVDDPTDPNDPNAIYLLPGEPQPLLVDPRADNGEGDWVIIMRAVIAVDPLGGPVEYQFDCFEDDSLDRDWSTDRVYQTRVIDKEDLIDYTFRVRARNLAGGVTDWSLWRWIPEVIDGP